MKVYVVETGCYTDSGVSGVYSSAEAAMAAHPPRRVVPDDYVATAACSERPGGWQSIDDDQWANGLDWDDHATITAYDLDDASDLSATPQS